jgi:hypothetical protein
MREGKRTESLSPAQQDAYADEAVRKNIKTMERRFKFRSQGRVLQGGSGSARALLNPTDPIHQMDPRFSPDKLELWDDVRPDHVIENNWAVLNRTHLNEAKRIGKTLSALNRRGITCRWECEAFSILWKHHCGWVLKRTESIKTFWIPKWETRFRFPEALKDAIDAYVNHIHRLSISVCQLEVGGSLSILLDEWKEYEASFRAFASLHENIGLMIYHAYFSPEEDQIIVQEVYRQYFHKAEQQKAEQQKAGMTATVIYELGEDDFRNHLMPREGFPPKLWDHYFKMQYQNYKDHVDAHRKALLCGKQHISSSATTSMTATPIQSIPHSNENPLDPKYQKHTKFPPNKLNNSVEALHEQIEDSPYSICLATYQKEIEDMKEALIAIQNRKCNLKEWEICSLRRWFASHLAFATQHYHSIRRMQIPVLESRIKIPPMFKEVMDNYIRELHDISELVDSVQVGDTVNELVDSWSIYYQKWLFAKKSIGSLYTMLYHAYFSREERREYFYKVTHNGGMDQIWGALIHYTGKDSSYELFVGKNRLSQIDWHLSCKPKYMDYLNAIVSQIKALKTGIPATRTEGPIMSKLYSMLHANLATESLPVTSKKTSTTSIDRMLLGERRDSMTSATCNYEGASSSPTKTARSKWDSSDCIQSSPTSIGGRRFSSPSIGESKVRMPQGLQRAASAANLGTGDLLSPLEDKKVTEKQINWRKSFRRSLSGLD